MTQSRSDSRAAIILAAGRGSRMKSATSKVLHSVGGLSMLAWSINLARASGAHDIIVVSGAHAPQVQAAAESLGVRTAVQDPPLGTGHAVQAAQAALGAHQGPAIVLYADTPLIQPGTVMRAFDALAAGAGVAVVGFEPADPGGYGRLIVNGAGGLERIVEAKDASAEERAVGLCNSGVMAADAALMFDLLSQVTNDNAKGEYYLTDLVGLARARGLSCAVAHADADEVLGVNSRADLAEAEAAFQARARRDALEAGVTLIAPETVFFAHDTELAADVTVEPHVVFGPGVRAEAGAVIRAFSHLEGAHIGAGAQVGPYARLRPGADIGEAARIGNFVEVKNTRLEAGAKASHLTYLGDAEVGAGANIGAGTITCNYDGFAKHRTVIGPGAFIGSDTALVAPVTVGAGAITGAGSVIIGDVPDDALAIARGEQREIAGGAASFRARRARDSGADKNRT